MATNAEEIQRKIMAGTPVEKTWTVAGYEGQGPVTLHLRLPEVTITDAEGRYIVVSPRQSALIGSKMADLADWLRYGDEDWVGDDPEENT